MAQRGSGVSDGVTWRRGGRVRRLIVAGAVAMLPVSPVTAAGPPEVDFAREVQPLLARRCFACHGPDTREAGLRLDDRAAATARLESGATALVPGDPDTSELLTRVRSADPDTRMEPGLLPPNVVDQHALPQALIQIPQAGDPPQRQAAGGRDDPPGFTGTSTRSRVDRIHATSGDRHPDPLRLVDSSGAQRDVECAADAALQVVVGRSGTNQDQVFGHVGGERSSGLVIGADIRRLCGRFLRARRSPVHSRRSG